MNRRIVAGLLGLGLLVSLPAAALDVPGAEVDLYSEYTFKWAQRSGGDDESDQDLHLGLELEVPSIGSDSWKFSGLLYYLQDLDGTRASDIYKDSLDSFGDRNDWRLYRARLSYLDPDRRFRVDAGRLEIWSAETATVDGALVDITPCRWASLDLFAGRRVSFYSDPDERAVYGGDLELNPWQGGTVWLQDLYYLENNLEATVAQRLGHWGVGRASYRRIGSDSRDASLGLFLYPWTDGEVHLQYLRMFNDYDYDYTSAEDDVAENLFLTEQQPYADYTVTLRQGFFGKLGIGARLRHHSVIEDSDEDTYNVDFDEGTLLMDLSEFPWKGLRLDGTVTRWVEDRQRSDITEDELWGFTARVEQALWTHALGAGYYKQSYDSDGGCRDTSGYDLWARLRLRGLADAVLRYEREEDDLYREDGIDALNVFTARLDLSF